jgi:hypothetical protein
VDTAKKVDPEDEKKLAEFILSELLRNVDPKSIRMKLVQAGWLESDVVRLITVATSKPDLKKGAVKAVDLEAILVFQKDGNLKLQRELIDAQLRKKRVEERLPDIKPKAEVVEERKLSLEDKILIARRVAHGAFILLLIWHAWLLQQKFMG